MSQSDQGGRDNSDGRRPSTPPKTTAEHAEKRGVSRRGFLSSLGAGAAAVAIPQQLAGQAPPAPDVVDANDLARVALRINDRGHNVLVESRMSLLHVLREKLGLTAAKEGCGRGECGACTVLVDGEPRYSCLTLAVEAEGHDVTTLEGLLEGEELGPVQQAFLEDDAFQCGYCTPGQIMATEGLLRDNPDPTLEEIRLGVSGNVCRCGAYANIFKAAARAAEVRRSEGGAS
jgi:xanthine dehydrogenase YagT iron-sulfur-binding subunit